METPISPWAAYAKANSPDGLAEAEYDDAGEVGMGAPTMGTLSVKMDDSRPEVVSERAAASMVWSDDSQFLAFSEWTSSKMQKLCVYSATNGSIFRFPEEYRVLELNGFSEGKISGVDSPIYEPETILVSFHDH